MPLLKTYHIEGNDDGSRLDRWFRRRFGAIGQGQIEKMTRTGQIRVDGRRVKSSTRLLTGQVVRVPTFCIPDRKSQVSNEVQIGEEDKEFIASCVIYKDEDIIALNKPPGIPVQGGTKVRRHIDGLLSGLVRFGEEVPKLVHRLDRDTSGVLVLARNASAAGFLSKAFSERMHKKTYWAIVQGVPPQNRGQIELALEKAGKAGQEKVFAGFGRKAITRYQIIDRAGRDLSWLALYPVTGRTHQLRVHCHAIGHPIVGDRKYGQVELEKSGVPNSNRLHLHARSMTLRHPRKGFVVLKAEPPDFFRESMKYFGFEQWNGDVVGDHGIEV
jgi:23S rRNA pseudouridine955/2504/2580 synthase